ncbi:pyridoxamine 5'-phosphate oxidase family protein [Mycolicibacterium rhodesiae]|uniref:Pyridoxamine 5'-phosphate oxidase n=1 Tax=Mycolicibacterium rhodesiae TaxID=36814 RepID=A0A1X0IUF7_MYCRH|nr:pyridoxamine 5'-phosphate oxidase family protein [Mycolicibacterium rhodesiae]MCV7346076.1 pyridoxamine 5'-phosphate oxidase family protein [Mycolicibacterium rhodesiae]ORB52363.1 pyridoxamine 5'-phosphate oxidase [Mycolicibacterium rhodesiae]
MTSPTYAEVLRDIRRQHFAVLSTSDTTGTTASAGVTYNLGRSGATIYVMTRRHLQKARNIAVNPEVSMVIPIPRKLLWGLPPATIQLRGHAKVVDSADIEARGVFSGFWLGRQILTSYEQLRNQGETRICFLRIDLDPLIRTYMVGTPMWQTRSRMEAGSATVVRPGDQGPAVM